MFSIIIALAIGASLFVLPIKSWFQQRDDLSIRNGELDILTAANDQLQLEVDRLQTPAGIAEAAREEIDYVEAGERRITVLPPTDAAISLPTGWPFDLITGIVSLRREEAQLAAAAAVASTTASTTNHSSLAPGSAPPTVGSEPSSIDPVQG